MNAPQKSTAGSHPRNSAVMEPLDTFLEIRRDGSGFSVRGDVECCRGDQADRGGIFAGWQWDGKRLRVANDRYGMFPLFYSSTRDGIMISHSLVRLLAEGASRDLDDDAIAVFLGMGWFVGEDTPFSAIKAVPPDANFTWTGGELHVSGRYITGPAQERDWDAAIDEYIHLFSQAVIRHCTPHERLIVPLSGGKDSRHILLALREAGRPPDMTVTFHQLAWQESNLDVPIARRLAAAAGVPHTVIRQPLDALRTERRKNLMTHFCSDEHSHYVVLADHLRNTPGALVDGIAGDTISESKDRGLGPLELFEAGRLRDIALMELGSVPYLSRLLTPEAYQRFHPDRAVARLEAELERHTSAAYPFGSFRFWNRTRREIGVSPYGILAERPVVAPFLDHDLFDFFISLPGRFVMGERRLHSAAIRRAYPDFADIPFDHERKHMTRDQLALYTKAAPKSALTNHLKSALWIGSAAAYALRSSSNDFIDAKYASLRTARSMAHNIEHDEAAPWLARTTVYLTQLQEAVAAKWEL